MQSVMDWVASMTDARSGANAAGASRADRSARSRASAVIQRLSRWWRDDSEEGYLACATDPADLERRQRVLERDRGRPLLDTMFNC
jgi:hypothetical protein